mgnify:CR=1 FL=1|tara:strand:+ start:482 stop:1540 length:1059 start_codon:yes stop_codon:yes gene_type:complete
MMLFIRKYTKMTILVLVILIGGCTIDMDEVNYDNFDHKNKLFFDLNENSYSINYIQLSKSDTIPFFKSLTNTKNKVSSEGIVVEYQQQFNYNDNIDPFVIDAKNTNRAIHNIFNKNGNDISIIKQPINATKSNLIFLNNYDLRIVFKSLLIPNKIKSIITSDEQINENDLIELMDQIIKMMYLETVQNVNIGFNHEQSYLASIDDWSKDVDFDPKKIIIFDESDLSLIEVSMKNLSYIIDAAEINLLSKIDESYIEDVKKSWLNKKMKLYSSLVLLFNNFTIQAIMPGEIIFHNAETVKGDTLIWNFNLSEFSDENYEIIASSRIVHSNRLIAFIFMVLLLAVIIIKKRFKK